MNEPHRSGVATALPTTVPCPKPARNGCAGRSLSLISPRTTLGQSSAPSTSRKRGRDGLESPWQGTESENQTARQRYQQVYQGQAQATKAWKQSTQLRSQFPEFADYWKEHKAGWLPEGFQRRNGLLGQISRRAGQGLRALPVPGHVSLPPALLGLETSRMRSASTRGHAYWEYVKSTGFVPKGEQDVKDSPDAVAYDDPESELHGKVLAVPIPKAWRASETRRRPTRRRHSGERQ
jgi:hypothetical protein